MDIKQIQEIAKKYRQFSRIAKEYTKEIVTAETNPLWADSPDPGEEDIVEHCAWMCDQITSGALERDKAMRWLCFVQGCFWSIGIKTIDEMKDDNR